MQSEMMGHVSNGNAVNSLFFILFIILIVHSPENALQYHHNVNVNLQYFEHLDLELCCGN